MTCVVGITKGSHLILAGDSAAVCSDDAVSRSARKDPKVFKLRDDLVLGFAGSFRQADLIRYKLRIPDYRGQGHRRYITTSFVDALRKMMKKNKFDMTEFGPLLIGFRKKLFTIDSDLHVGEDRNCYAAIGAGDYYALGAFQCLKLTGGLKSSDPVDLRAACKTALKTACHLSGAVLPPFTFVHIDQSKI